MAGLTDFSLLNDEFELFDPMNLTEQDINTIDLLVASVGSSGKDCEKDLKHLEDNETERPAGHQETGQRFKKLTEADLTTLQENRQSTSTKKNTRWAVKIFQDWNVENGGGPVHFNEIRPDELNMKLQKFYAEATPKTTEKRVQELGSAQAQEYHKNTMKSIRSGINRHLNDIGLNYDIVRDKEFRKSNEMLDAKLKTNVVQGLSRPTKHKPIIEKNDLSLISTYLSSEVNPVILRYEVWYNLSIHFVSRGLEFHKQLNPSSFHFHVDAENQKEYVTLCHETRQKNRQGGLESEDSPSDKRMYATGDQNCPVAALRLLLDKTDPNSTALFNHCSKDAMLTPQSVSIWYISKPVQHYQFTRFMGDISRNAKCFKLYKKNIEPKELQHARMSIPPTRYAPRPFRPSVMPVSSCDTSCT